MMIRNAVIATTILAASAGFAFAQTGAQSGGATTKPDQPVVNDKNPAQPNDKAVQHQQMRKPSATTGSGAAIKQEEQERFSSPGSQQGGDVEREK